MLLSNENSLENFGLENFGLDVFKKVFLTILVSNILVYLRDSEVLEGLKSCGRLVGFISAEWRVKQPSWGRVMVKKPFSKNTNLTISELTSFKL